MLGIGQAGVGEQLGVANARQGLGQGIYGLASNAGQNFANLGQQQFGQQLGAAQAQQGIANQIYGMGANTAQIQGSLAGQQYGMGANTAAQQASMANSLYGFNANNAAGTAAIGNQVYNQGMGLGQAQQGIGAQLFGQGAQSAQIQAGAANQMYQQQLGAASANAGLGGQLYGQGANTASLLGQLGSGAQAAALQSAQAQIGAGTLGQQTQQAGQTALYNQFLQQQSYPFQTAQFLSNIAEGTGSLSGSTTTTTQPGGFFSDRRLKEDVRKVGKTFDGQDIVTFRYKGEPKTQMGLIAQEVEKKHPEAVGLAGGYKTVDYGKATEDAASRAHRASGGLVARNGFDYGGQVTVPGYDPNLMAEILGGQRQSFGGAPGLGGGLPGGGGFSRVPQANLPVGHLAVAAPPPQQPSTIDQLNSMATLGKDIGGLKGLFSKKGDDSTYQTSDESKADLQAIEDSQKARGGLVGYANGGMPYQTPVPGALAIPNEPPHLGSSDITHPGAASAQASGIGQIGDALKAAKGVADYFDVGGVNDAARGGRINRDAGGTVGQDDNLPYPDSGPGLDIPDKLQAYKLAVAQPPKQSSGSGVGGVLGAIGHLFGISDKRLKENIEPIGKTFDGQTVYRYNFKGDPRPQIGLIAQEVEKKHPGAVALDGKYKVVDYKRATPRTKKADGGSANDDSGPTDQDRELLRMLAEAAHTELPQTDQPTGDDGPDEVAQQVTNSPVPPSVGQALAVAQKAASPALSTDTPAKPANIKVTGDRAVWRDKIAAEADKQGLTPVEKATVVALAQHESGFNPTIEGPLITKGSHVGDRPVGLFQYMASSAPGWDRTDPEQQVVRGVSQFKRFADKYGVRGALAMWMSGNPKAGSPGGPDPSDAQSGYKGETTSKYIGEVGNIAAQYLANNAVKLASRKSGGRTGYATTGAVDTSPLTTVEDTVGADDSDERKKAELAKAFGDAFGAAPKPAAAPAAQAADLGAVSAGAYNPAADTAFDDPAANLAQEQQDYADRNGLAGAAVNSAPVSPAPQAPASSAAAPATTPMPDVANNLPAFTPAPVAGVGSILDAGKMYEDRTKDRSFGSGIKHGRADALLPILAGLAAMGTAPTRSFGVALAAGLGAGTQAYQTQRQYNAGLAQQQADVALRQQGLGNTGAEINALQASVPYQMRNLGLTGSGLAQQPALIKAQVMEMLQRGMVDYATAKRILDLLPGEQATQVANIKSILAGNATVIPQPGENGAYGATIVKPVTGEVTNIGAPGSAPGAPTANGAPNAPGDTWYGGTPKLGSAAPRPAGVWHPDTSYHPGDATTITSEYSPAGAGIKAKAIANAQHLTDTAQAAYAKQYELDTIMQQAANLPADGWLASGAGASWRGQTARALDAYAVGLTGQHIMDPNQLGAYDTIQKYTNMLGFNLAHAMGSNRNAASIIQTAISTNPGVENTPMAFKRLVAAAKMASQYDIDRAAYYNDYAAHAGNLVNAEAKFAQRNPASMYARRAVMMTVPPQASDYLKKHPDTRNYFDQTYGQGVSSYYLGH